MSDTKYIKSKIDNNIYCKTNGQFTRHINSSGLTYKDYFELYVTGITPLCYCGKPKTFYQKTETYANSCGSPECVGKTISNTKSQWTVEQKLQDSINKRKAVLDKGYIYELWLYKDKNNYRILKNDSDFQTQS